MWLLLAQQKGFEVIDKSIDVDSSPPPLPAGDEELDVYTGYGASLDAFDAAHNDAVQTIKLRKQGHVAWLRGKAMLLAKESSKVKLNWEEIFEAFDVKRSTGFVHRSIAEGFTEDEAKDTPVNELREKLRDSNVPESETEPDGGDSPTPKLYSIKQGRNDLKAAKDRLVTFAKKIGNTADAENNPQSAPVALSAFDADFDELTLLVTKAETARGEAIVEITNAVNAILTEGADLRLAGDGEEVTS